MTEAVPLNAEEAALSKDRKPYSAMPPYFLSSWFCVRNLRSIA